MHARSYSCTPNVSSKEKAFSTMIILVLRVACSVELRRLQSAAFADVWRLDVVTSRLGIDVVRGGVSVPPVRLARLDKDPS